MLSVQSPPSVPHKVPKKKPLQGPQRGPLWRELPVSRVFFNMSLNFLVKVLIKINVALLSKPYERSVPPHIPQDGALTETGAYFQSLT